MVERHVANVNVESSNLFTRLRNKPALAAGLLRKLVAYNQFVSPGLCESNLEAVRPKGSCPEAAPVSDELGRKQEKANQGI